MYSNRPTISSTRMFSMIPDTAALALVAFVTYACSEETDSNLDIDHLLSKIYLLETKFTEQSTKIMVQEKMLSMQNTKIALLQHAVSEQAAKASFQETRMADLNAKNADQDTAITNLLAGTELSASQIATLKAENVCRCRGRWSENNEILDKLDHLSDRVTKIEDGEEWKNWTREAIQRESGGGHIAFFVRMTENVKTTSEILVWNNVITNLGNGYNSATGIFTAPDSGVYVFQWMMLAVHRTIGSTLLIVNGVKMKVSVADPGRTDAGMTDTVSAILTLDKGDEVLIKRNVRTLKIYGKLCSAFQGFKLR